MADSGIKIINVTAARWCSPALLHFFFRERATIRSRPACGGSFAHCAARGYFAVWRERGEFMGCC